MEIQFKSNDVKLKELVKSLFFDTAFGGFSFDMFFTLKFYRCSPASYNNNPLPQEIEIRILSNWWFDTKESWAARVNQLTTYDLVEPEEPILAYELACIRWMEGSEIEDVNLVDDRMTLLFRSGKSISISLESSDDYAWVIQETMTCEKEVSWSLVCDNEEFFVKTP